MDITQVFRIEGRGGPIVVGPVLSGRITSRDPTELVNPDGTVVPVPTMYVEMHSRPGELAAVLVGVDPEAVKPGQRLRWRDRWPNYSPVIFVTDAYRDDGAPIGSRGTIIEVYGDGYEVEVCDSTGRTLFLGAVADRDIEPAD